MTRDQAFIHACDEANKSRPLTDAEVDQLVSLFEVQNARKQEQARLKAAREARAAKKAADPVYARSLERQRERYRKNPEFRARQIAAATARYHARKRAQV